MNNRIIIKLTILFLVFTNVCCSQNELKTYEKENYAISYPDNWRLDTTGQMNSKFILFSELKDNDLFSENVNMITQDLTNQGFTMESYMKLSENQIKTLVTEGKIIKSIIDKENGYCTLIWSGNVTDRVLKFKQYFFMKKEIVYVLTLTTLPETFEDYIEAGDKILNSFKLK